VISFIHTNGRLTPAQARAIDHLVITTAANTSANNSANNTSSASTASTGPVLVTAKGTRIPPLTREGVEPFLNFTRHLTELCAHYTEHSREIAALAAALPDTLPTEAVTIELLAEAKRDGARAVARLRRAEKRAQYYQEKLRQATATVADVMLGVPTTAHAAAEPVGVPVGAHGQLDATGAEKWAQRHRKRLAAGDDSVADYTRIKSTSNQHTSNTNKNTNNTSISIINGKDSENASNDANTGVASAMTGQQGMSD